jgi:hypothetical protein
MATFDWHDAVALMDHHVVKIMTPDVSGTGFLAFRSRTAPIIGIATAAHVVRHAGEWEQPLKIKYFANNEECFLHEKDRAIILNEEIDTAVVLVRSDIFSFPENPHPLKKADDNLRLGERIGWLGYPAMSPDDMCFFSGRISSQLKDKNGYLVDGVAINGVSGGPAFTFYDDKTIAINGVVTAYVPNMATGEALPGLCLISDVKQLHEVIQGISSMEQAKAKEKSRK